jgi:hypothetical protein
MTKLGVKHLYIDPETHKIAKVQASKEGLSIQEWIKKLIESYRSDALNHNLSSGNCFIPTYKCSSCGILSSKHEALTHNCGVEDEK